MQESSLLLFRIAHSLDLPIWTVHKALQLFWINQKPQQRLILSSLLLSCKLDNIKLDLDELLQKCSGQEQKTDKDALFKGELEILRSVSYRPQSRCIKFIPLYSKIIQFLSPFLSDLQWPTRFLGLVNLALIRGLFMSHSPHAIVLACARIAVESKIQQNWWEVCGVDLKEIVLIQSSLKIKLRERVRSR